MASDPKVPVYPIKVGKTGANIIAVEQEFHPVYGRQLTFIYEGDQGQMENTAALSLMGGARARSYQFNGPVYRATVSYGNADGANELPQVQWDFDTEFVQEDLFSSAMVVEAAGGAEVVATWKDDILLKAKSGTNGGPMAPAATGFTNEKLELYRLYAVYGQRAVEVERPILRRVQTFSLYWLKTDNPYRVNGTPTVYDTARMVQDFGIPTYIANKLPTSFPAAPQGKVWAWKVRKQRRVVSPLRAKVEEVTDWVLATWPTLTYEYLS